jgi:hypothetical protein
MSYKPKEGNEIRTKAQSKIEIIENQTDKQTKYLTER